jgi:tRNA 2-thiouridine synthesizing protein A
VSADEPASASVGPAAVTVVEARGVLCPVPIIRLARVTRSLPAGSLVEVLSDDPAAAHDIPAWCRGRGHELLETSDVTRSSGGQRRDGGTGPIRDHPEAHVPPGAEPAVGAPLGGTPLRHLIRVGER